MEAEKFKNTCRTCMSEKEDLLSIFEIQIWNGDSIQMVDFIYNLTAIEISQSDGLPQHLCIDCVDMMCKIYYFIELCKDSNANFRLVQTAAKEDQCESSITTDRTNNEMLTLQPKLKQHTSTQKENQQHQCMECLKSFTKQSHLTLHKRTHTNLEDKLHVCDVCGQRFNYSYLLKRHSFKHSDKKPFPCEKCDKGCLTAESLRRHMVTHEENYMKKVHICSVCGKEFPYPSILAEHMKHHTGEKPFLCSICGKGFRQKSNLEQHHLCSHCGYKPYKCEVCEKRYTSKGVLKVHMRCHTDERPYICDICGFAFRQSNDMKRHRLIHSGRKTALCTVCGKQMSTTGQLTVHLRSHTGEKPFNCEVCEKGFTTRMMLVKHTRIHTGERPYVCKICGQSFNQSSTLKSHGIVHKRVDNKI
ncbi:hypothetical protein PPYR_08589 [Photinus pyralis]|uniref:Protein krueppel n=1 Tax=Photinus pyralis TaxID=7054 RepID=A0A1Y1L4E3_PHOPY|nr:zinc finger protein 93-like [Photinus pyralis]KAB0797596.1 hypothetical protein PPYR_08589 [Photinus pyralis]